FGRCQCYVCRLLPRRERPERTPLTTPQLWPGFITKPEQSACSPVVSPTVFWDAWFASCTLGKPPCPRNCSPPGGSAIPRIRQVEWNDSYAPSARCAAVI